MSGIATQASSADQRWDWMQFGELFAIQQGKALSQKARRGANPRPFLRTSNVSWGKLDIRMVDRMDFSPEEVNKYSLEVGDLLVCEGGDVGRAAVWRGELEVCGYQNHIHRCRPLRNDVDPNFYMYWMQYAFLIGNLYLGRANITTIANLSKSRLAAFDVPHPPLSEQRVIAHVLNSVQGVGEQTEQVITAARELKQSLIRRLFQQAAQHKISELGNLIERPQYGHTASATRENLGPRFVRITDIQEGEVDWSTVPFCECRPQQRERYLLRPGDLLVARIGATTGKTLFVSEVPGDAIFASYLIRLRAKGDLYPAFLAYFTQSDLYWTQINIEKGGRLKTGVNAMTLTRLQIPHPPRVNQREVAEILLTVDKKIAAEKQRRVALDSLFRSLLHDLMTARLGVGQLAR